MSTVTFDEVRDALVHKIVVASNAYVLLTNFVFPVGSSSSSPTTTLAERTSHTSRCLVKVNFRTPASTAWLTIVAMRPKAWITRRLLQCT
jgi:hypothetical protein